MMTTTPRCPSPRTTCPHIVSSSTAYLSAHFGGFLAIFPPHLPCRTQYGWQKLIQPARHRHPSQPGQRRHRRRRYALPAAFRGRSEGPRVTIESWIAIRLTRYLNEDDLRLLEHDVRRALADVRACYTDLEGAWSPRSSTSPRPCTSCAAPPSATARNLRRQPPRGVEPASHVEVAHGLPALAHRGNFVFMGVKERVLDGTSGAIALVDRPGSALGILRSTEGKSRIPLSGDTLDRALFPRPCTSRRLTPVPRWPATTTWTTLVCAASI